MASHEQGRVMTGSAEAIEVSIRTEYLERLRCGAIWYGITVEELIAHLTVQSLDKHATSMTVEVDGALVRRVADEIEHRISSRLARLWRPMRRANP